MVHSKIIFDLLQDGCSLAIPEIHRSPRRKYSKPPTAFDPCGGSCLAPFTPPEMHRSRPLHQEPSCSPPQESNGQTSGAPISAPNIAGSYDKDAWELDPRFIETSKSQRKFGWGSARNSRDARVIRIRRVHLESKLPMIVGYVQ